MHIFFVSIQTKCNVNIPLHKRAEISIDMRIVRFATLFNGDFWFPENAFKTKKGKLAKTGGN